MTINYNFITKHEKRDLKWIRESNLIENIDDPIEDHISYAAWIHLLCDDFMPNSIDLILKCHKLIMIRHNPKIAGQLRIVDVRVGDRRCPNFQDVPDLILRWLVDHGTAKGEKAIQEAHVAFEKVHPFQDGNGRSGRMIMNLQRVLCDLPPLCIKAKERGDYYEWFREPRRNEYEKLLEIFHD